MSYGDRCLLVHGHFYQPPRENPWTGQIEPQYSAAPWENWNRRIADECYLPMARSRVFGEDGGVVDLYNNYAHTSFNFGPTLLSWLNRVHPAFIRHLNDAATLDRTFAMAQAYSHMMLPLADARDRHTQILWGLREFHHRFGFFPEGMWLSECGIDPETARALIDHKIRYLILSPHQASRARPFGQRDWRDVSMGALDTRRAYRLFDIDGGGRTHFDRHLDIVFYTPGLNLKVSFDHILNRPEDLARELENCYRPDYNGSQLVSIVTDGEIYGHHEKHGEEALSRLYHDIAPSLGLKVVSASEFIRDNPPGWEVKLWNGDDKRGSSWSCEHGMGRWYRNCGCRPPAPPGWTQEWRGPLRDAFDAIRDRVRFVTRRELGKLVWDADEALNNYVGVLLSPTVEERRRYVDRHAQRTLDLAELERLWRMLESLHNAMLMYTSCGWFFDEVSGLEPVQNMRYALRACELIAPDHDEDLVALLEQKLAGAKSNIPYRGDGGKVFRDLALPSRYSNRELAAAMAVCLATDFPTHGLSWKLVDKTETVHYQDSDGNEVAWGSFVCHDRSLDRFVKTAWVTRLDDMDNSGVGLHGYEEVQGDAYRSRLDCPLAPDTDFNWLRDVEARVKKMKREELLQALAEFSVPYSRLPDVVRGMLYRRFSGGDETALLHESARLGTRAVPFLARARRHGARVPETIAGSVTRAFEQEILDTAHAAIGAMRFDNVAADAIGRHLASARELGLSPSLDECWRSLYLTGLELYHWLFHVSERGWLDARRPVTLSEGGEWIAPASQATHDLRYPYASGYAAVLGRGLTLVWARIKAADDPGLAALTGLPIPELLEFMGTLGLDSRGAVALGREYWDFLDQPLARLIRKDPEGIMAGEAGERVRLSGALLGFSPAVIDKRIEAAVRGTVRK